MDTTITKGIFFFPSFGGGESGRGEKQLVPEIAS